MPRESTAAGGAHEDPVDAGRVDEARLRVPDAEDAARMTSVLSLVADPTRARLLYALDVVKELCVGDLALALDLNQDAVGYGLRLLRTAGLVTRRQSGRTAFYRLADGFPEPLLEHCVRQLVTLSQVFGSAGGEG